MSSRRGGVRGAFSATFRVSPDFRVVRCLSSPVHCLYVYKSNMEHPLPSPSSIRTKHEKAIEYIENLSARFIKKSSDRGKRIIWKIISRCHPPPLVPVRRYHPSTTRELYFCSSTAVCSPLVALDPRSHLQPFTNSTFRTTRWRLSSTTFSAHTHTHTHARIQKPLQRARTTKETERETR